ncbi:MAG TPA: protelomerase family protein [Candidatus Caenarcaniphilales bacterium]
MGKRSWLEDQLHHRYLNAIAILEDTPTGRAEAEQLAQTMRQEWSERGMKEMTQQQGLMDRTRRAIKDRFGDKHFSLEFIKFSREEQFKLNSQKRQRANQRNLTQQYLVHPDKIVAQAVRLLGSPEWVEVAAGLTVLTGRRSTEILKTAEFELKSQWIVGFRGALKRRGEVVPLEFDFPPLTTAQRVVDALQWLRSQVETQGMSEEEVSRCYGDDIIRASDRHFAELVPCPPGKESLYTHLWRSVYACIATFWYCPKHAWDILFKAYILGHFEALDEAERDNTRLRDKRLTTIASERFYALYEIADEVVAYYKGQRKGIKLGYGGIEPLEAFREAMPENQPVREPRKHRTSIRMWQEDRPLLEDIFARLGLEDKTQQERMGLLLRWVSDRLDQQAEVNAPSQLVEVDEPLAEESPKMAAVLAQPKASLMMAEAPSAEEPETQSVVVELAAAKLEQPATFELEQKFDKLMDVMTQFVTLQMQQAQEQFSPTIQSAKIHRVSISNSATSEQSTSQAEATAQPRQRMKTSQTEEMVNRAIDAIIKHNSTPQLSHDRKWAITVNGLKAFVKSQRKIEQILTARHTEIVAHHQQHQIDPERHNYRHRGKQTITQVIQV